MDKLIFIVLTSLIFLKYIFSLKELTVQKFKKILSQVKMSTFVEKKYFFPVEVRFIFKKS